MHLDHVVYVVTDPWGSLAEWVAGIGTLAAVSVSLYVVLGDRIKQKRSEADTFSTWSKVGHRVLKPLNEPEITEFWVETNFYNAGGRPVPYVSLSWWDGTGWSRQIGMANGGGVEPDVISPGERGFVRAPVDGGKPLNWNAYFITFTDGSGSNWYRSPKDNGYLSKRTMNRLTKRGPRSYKAGRP